jgi:hypothetical protein
MLVDPLRHMASCISVSARTDRRDALTCIDGFVWMTQHHCGIPGRDGIDDHTGQAISDI